MRGTLAILAVLLLICSPALPTAPAGADDDPDPTVGAPQPHDKQWFDKVIFVDDDGGANFTSIQEAIDAAEYLDVIWVYEGTYRENLVIDEYIMIIGNDTVNTTVAGDGTTDVVRVLPGVGAELVYLTITGGGTHAGINLAGSWGSVSSCIVEGNRYGVRAERVMDGIRVWNVTATNNTDAGIWVVADSATIDRNRCWQNGVGISHSGKSSLVRMNVCGFNDRGISVGTSPRNVLLMGNSYTQANGLDDLLERLMVGTVPDVDATLLASGGLTLADHADRASTPGDGWNRTLNGGSPWDTVVLQDQSQVPGFPTDNAYWQASMEGAGTLDGMVNVTGADTVLLMTWGRRDGDPTNPGLYPNFTVMQDRLEAGYRMYAENLTTPDTVYGPNDVVPGRRAYIAPAGVAFRVVHRWVQEAGADPTSPGNAFYDLYSSDGSHPSLTGSYLAACVLYATLTGNSPADIEDDVAIKDSVKRLLQDAAAVAVFDETPDYVYPWRPASDMWIEVNTLDRNGVGMMVGCLASGNEVRACEFTENHGAGVHVLDRESGNNTLHGNGFRGNAQGGIQAVDGGRDTAWDNGNLGNYWDDYEARYPDAIHDEVRWDTPYVLASGSRDRWPRASFRPFEDHTPPVARAGPDVEVGQGVTVRFDGLASTDDRGVANHTWTFGYDGNDIVLHGAEAEFTFQEVGVYEVTLTVSDEAGNTAEDWLRVTVRDTTPPVANAGYDVVVDQNQEVTLDGTGSTDNGVIVEHTWVIRDRGATVLRVGPVVSYTFLDVGVYNVTLIVTDDAGNAANDTVSITVRDVTHPVADAGKDREVDQGDTVTFDGGGSRDDVRVVGYAWAIEDLGGTHVEEGQIVEHTFAHAGVFTATLTVRDLEGNTATATVRVTVRDTSPPVADAGRDRTVDEGHVVVLDGTGSSDNVGITDWIWTFTDGDVQRTVHGFLLEWTFDDPGVYQVQLTVQDAMGNYDLAMVAVTVLDITAPEAARLPGLSVRQGEAVTLDGTASTDNVAVASHAWTYEEDGTMVTLEGPRVEHTFALAGEFTVHLTVQDAAGNTDTSSFLVVVRDSEPPQVPPVPDIETWTGRRVTMASGATDNVGVTEYTWTFRDGGDEVVLRGRRVTHAFEDPGDHRVTLTVQDAEGNQATQEFTVTVQRPLWTWAALAGVAIALGSSAVVVTLRWTRSRTGRRGRSDGDRS